MIRGCCPICDKTFEAESAADWPSFPFCSDRCKLIDLGRWIDGDYGIPGEAKLDEEPDDSEDAE